MKKSIKLIALILSLTLFFTACVTQNSSGNEDANGGSERTSVNLAVNATINSVDGHGPKVLQDLLTRAQLFEGLFYLVESTATIEKRVCDEYSLSEDETEYVFHIRPDVLFHNGDPVEASDVAFSLKRAGEMAGTKAYVAAIDDIEVVDNENVKVTLKNPSAPFLTNLCQVYIQSEKIVTEQGDEFGTKAHLAGCGPYYLDKLDMSVGWTLKAFPDYWRGEANIPEINYTVITDTSSGLVAFESGDLDWYDAPIANWDDLVKNQKFETELMAANHITYFCVNPEANDVLANDKVREAIFYAVDKNAMNASAFNGNAEVAYFLENPDFNIGAPEEGLTFSYDPEKAKSLLKEAGYDNGVDIGTILCFTGSHFEKCAQILQANLASVGITAELEWVDQTTNTTRARAQDYDIVVSGTSPTGDFDHIRLMFHADYAGSKMIALEASPDKFDYQELADLIDKSAQTLDEEARLEINEEINTKIMETHTICPLLYKVHPYVWNKDLNVVNMPTNYQVYDWSWK